MAWRDKLIPDPLFSDRQYCRYYHLDLPDLDDRELIDELHYLRPLLWELRQEHWLQKRVQMLKNEIEKRGHLGEYSRYGRPKPRLAEGVRL